MFKTRLCCLVIIYSYHDFVYTCLIFSSFSLSLSRVKKTKTVLRNRFFGGLSNGGKTDL